MESKPETILEQPRTANRVLRGSLFALLVLGIIALYHFFGSDGNISHEPASLFKWLNMQYHHRDMNLTWIMPLVGFYAIWDRRKQLAATPANSSLLGLLATLASLAVHILAFRAQQPRISLFSIPTTLWCIAWALWGWGVAKQLLFPLGYTILSFLCFHITHYTTALQVFASNLAVSLLRGFGVDAANTGSVIRATLSSQEAPIVFNVAEGCSGLRSLVVLSALAAPYAYFRVRGNIRAWILFAASVPLAILTNVLRISTLTLFAYLFGNELAMQVYHDPAGFLVFFIGILLLRATATFLERDWSGTAARIRTAFQHRFGSPKPQPSETPESRNYETAESRNPEKTTSRGFHPAVVFTVLALAIGGAILFLSRPRVFTGDPTCPIDVQLPEYLGPYHGEEVLFCSNDQCCRDYPKPDFSADGSDWFCPVCSNKLDTISIGERSSLPDGTPVLRRVYTLGNSGTTFQVSVVYSGIERNSLHRPQLCLVAQGYQVINEHTFHAPMDGAPDFPIHVLDTLFRSKNDAGRTTFQGGIYAYWYFNPETYTPDHFTRVTRIALDNLFRDYRPRWAYISISFACDADHREKAYDTLRDVVPRLVPFMRDSQAALLSYEHR